jgi:ATP-dependent RNA helicase RhlB
MSDWKLEEFDIPEVADKDRFHDFALPEPLMRAIAEVGYEYCTPIQSKTLPFALSDYDVTGQAQTGTGKTAAFLIAVLTRFWELPLQEEPKLGCPRALILAPTRELALQIEGDAKGLSKYMDERTVCVVGGMDFNKQLDKLEKKPVDLLVATPGRLIDFLDRSKVSLRNVEVLVIDEADRMLDMGFIPDVKRIVYQTPHKKRRQTLFFSATFNEDVMRLAESWTIDAVHIVIEPESVATDTVDQRFWMIGQDQKDKALLSLLENATTERAIVFANRRDQTHRLVKFLQKHNVPCEALAGDVPQRKRLATLNRFKDGDLKFLVATDVAGRGIHVEGISHVINYELPEDPEDYVHRIGRTGRAGALGISISFVSEDDAFNLPAIEQYIGMKVDCTVPDFDLSKQDKKSSSS